MQKCVDCVISGKNLDYKDLLVIKKEAEDFNLRGTTFFKDDGSVKIVAEGEEEILEKFIKNIKEDANVFAFVENFSVKWSNSKSEFDNFSIS
ncbi:MAG: acylphosphatase [Candidatus Paceibacterota bacterium]|jgi:acylphosphatase